MKAAPYREDFLKSLAKEDDREQLLATMTPYIHAYVKVCKVRLSPARVKKPLLELVPHPPAQNYRHCPPCSGFAFP